MSGGLLRASLHGEVLLAAFLMSGCGPLKTTVPAQMGFEVPGTGLLGVDNPLTEDEAFPADQVGATLGEALAQSIDASGHEKDAVSSLILDELTLTVLDPEERGVVLRDLGILEKLTVFLGAPGEPLRVAESAPDAFASRPTAYDMPTTRAELVEALQGSDTLELSAEVVPGRRPELATKVQIDATLEVEISLW